MRMLRALARGRAGAAGPGAGGRRPQARARTGSSSHVTPTSPT
eukprot:COSAG02_NODE_2484_length_8718_cov_11.929806_7_plen_42_part_01